MSLMRQEFADQFELLNTYTSPVKHMTRPLVGREHELKVLRAAMMRPELCNVILLAEAGCGKALADDTPIPVADERGYVNIHDIVPGDYVFDENGKPTKVLGVYPQGRIPAYKMIFTDGSEIICNDEHIWHARNCRINSEYQDITLKDILIDGVFYGKQRSYKWRLPLGKAVDWTSKNYPIDPYVMGAIISGGCLTERPLTISTAKEDVAVKIADKLGAEARRNYKNYSWRFRNNNSDISNSCIQTSELSEMLVNSGIEDTVFFKRAVERRIPEIYMTGSIEERIAFIQGMMDISGRVSSDEQGTCYFTASNKGMAEDMKTLLGSLGYQTKIWEPKNFRKSYKVRILGNYDKKRQLFSCKSLLERVDKFCKDGIDKSEVALVDVIELGINKKMTCIYVEGESHLFQCGKNHLVTHNTALVQGMMASDTESDYMEVDLSRMIANVNDKNEMATRLKDLFSQVIDYREVTGHKVVLFIDEFHQVVQLSDAAVEALKPMLADSGTRGVRVIAATTYEEFRKWISPNLPLVERLQRINLTQPNKEVCVAILRSLSQQYGVEHQFKDDHMFELIYEYTNRYVPAASQPRKSILLLDSMIGWHRSEGRRIDHSLLADVIHEQEGINVAFRVDARRIKESLDKRVLSQQFATTVLEQRLQICVADLNDKTKPMSSFLFTGSSGVGKTEMTKALAELLFDDDRNLIRMDMTEYANSDSLERFRSELTNKVWTHPYSIILMDEIEKACSEVTRILLQVLDDGRLIDDNNREVTFTNAYIILTTNAGSEVYRNISQYNIDNDGSGKEMKKYNKLIRASITKTTGNNRFPPELLGRIDCIVPFQPLSEETMKKIARNKLLKLRNMVATKHDVKLSVDPRIVKYLVEDNLDTDSDSGGARTVVAKLESEVTMAVARYINENPEEKQIRVYVEGELASENKNRLTSNAYVNVIAYNDLGGIK